MDLSEEELRPPAKQNLPKLPQVVRGLGIASPRAAWSVAGTERGERHSQCRKHSFPSVSSAAYTEAIPGHREGRTGKCALEFTVVQWARTTHTPAHRRRAD